MTAKVSKKNSFSTLSYQVLWLGSGIRPPRTIPLGPERMKYAIEMRNKEIQIKTMRDFLLRKVDIVNKLESLKSNSREKIVLSDEDWEEIEIFLNNADGNFTIRLHQTFPDLATKDVHLLMLLRLGISNASMAAIYNIEEKSIRQNLFLVKNSSFASE